MRIFVFILFVLLSNEVAAQRNHYWVFGDSVGINFNFNPPLIDTTCIIQTHEPAASIADESGSLLFYAGSASINQMTNGCKKYVVRCANDSVMPGGDSLAGHCSITQGLIILPDPGDTNKYYIFHIDYQAGGNPTRLFYSTVDMSLNNGLGAVIQSNILLTSAVSEKMHAVKAGNGLYWWLLVTHSNPTPGVFNVYKVDTVGVQLIKQTPIGVSASSYGAGQMVFSPNGDKLLFTGGIGPSMMYDFDRCAGVISNPVNILNWVMPNKQRYGCSFSPSGKYVYISSFDSLWQFDAQAASISLSKTLIASVPNPPLYYGFGQHLLSPDGKIYIATTFDKNNTQGLDSIISHLTVINNPDSAGINCNVMPFSFSLNGRKSYLNLPNMPNYNLGPLENVNCDSILTVNDSESNVYKVFPNPGNGKFTIELLKQVESINIDVFTLLGNNIYTSQFYPAGSWLELDLTTLPEGVYLMQITGESRVIGSRKIVVLK